MHNETNEQAFMQNVMQKNVSLGFVLRKEGVDLVQHISGRGHFLCRGPGPAHRPSRGVGGTVVGPGPGPEM